MQSVISKLNNRYLPGLPVEVGVLALIAFCVALGYGIIAPIVPLFAGQFGVSAAAASSVVSVFALMRLISAAAIGRTMDRLGERKVLWIGLSSVAVSTALAGAADSFAAFLLLRSAGGLGSAMFSVSAMSLLVRTTPQDIRARASSVYQSGFLFGGIAGPAIGSLMVGNSLSTPFYFYAGTLVMAMLIGAAYLPRKGFESIPETESSAEVAISIRQALRSEVYQLAILISFVSGVVTLGMRNSIIPIFVTSGLKQTAVAASVGFLVATIAQAIALTRSGRISDLQGRRKALLIGSAALFSAMTLMTFVESVPGFITSMILLGAGAAFLGPSASALVADFLGQRKSGRVIAGYQMVSDFGAIIGPLLTGWLLDVTGSFRYALGVGVLVSLLALIRVWRMPR